MNIFSNFLLFLKSVQFTDF